MPEDQKSFWSTVPGIITAIATLVTAVGGFIVVLNQVGVFGAKDEGKKPGIANQKQVENLDRDDRKEKEAALEAKIIEMQKQIDETRRNTPSSPQSQTEKKAFSDLAQIGGTWYDRNGAYYTITQSGTNVAMQEVSNVYGTTTITAAGQGSVYGRTVIFNITTLFNTTGTARMQLSEDKTLLTGEYKDNVAGTTTYLRLSRSLNNFGVE